MDNLSKLSYSLVLIKIILTTMSINWSNNCDNMPIYKNTSMPFFVLIIRVIIEAYIIKIASNELSIYLVITPNITL